MNKQFTRNRTLSSLATAAVLSAAFTGCQSTPFSSLGFPSWGTQTKVSPPPTGSFQVPGNYSGGSTASGMVGGQVPTTTITTPPGGVPAPRNATGGMLMNPNVGNGTNGVQTSQMQMTPSPLLGSITNAQNQIHNATLNATNAVQQSTQQLNSRVEQASARLDRFGQGVVQASQILNEAATAPVVTAGGNSLTDRSFAPSPDGIPGTNGYASTANSVRTGDAQADPNAQWRQPSTPR